MAPRLSVVVPVYNVEPYLEPCLRSLAEQTLTDLDVVVVDDGSTDGSAAVARSFAAADSRFRLVSQENAGLGAARNAGVRAVLPGTRYLAFVDSDDIVPPDAYARMVGSLEETGSDLVTGNVLRLRSGGRLEPSPMFRKPMARTRRATHITRDDRLLGDRIACNKVFRRDFWEGHGLAFPEGVLYEDIAAVLPAHYLAASVDVLSSPVYHWRDRDGSITTRRASARGVRDRVRAVRTVGDFLRDRYAPGGGDVKRRFDRAALTGDLWLFMEVLPHGDESYRQAFLEHTNAFMDTVDPSVLTGMPVNLRTKWFLVRKHRMPELLALLAFEKNNPRTFAVRGTVRRRAVFPPLPERAVPREVRRLHRRDLPASSRLTEAHWHDGRLHLRGWAHVRNLPAGEGHVVLRSAWLQAGRRRVVPLRIRARNAPEATHRSGQDLHSYDRAGFEIVVDPRRLTSRRRSTTWQLRLVLLADGIPRRCAVGAADTSTVPAVHHLDGSTRVVPSFRRKRLRLTVETVRARLRAHRLLPGPDGTGTLRLEGKLLGPADAVDGRAQLRLAHWHSDATLTCPVVRDEESGGGVRFHADVPLASLRDARPTPGPDEGPPRRSDPWGVRLVLGDGTEHPVAVRELNDLGRHPLGPGGPEGAPRELCVTASARGNLLLCDQTVQPVADTVYWADDGRLVLEGTCPRDPEHSAPPVLVLRHSRQGTEAHVPVEERDGSFRAVLRPESAAGRRAHLPLAEGNWYLFFRAQDADGPEDDAPMRLTPAEHHALPRPHTAGGRTYTADRRFHDRLLLVSGSALPPAERGRQGQRRLRAAYARQRTEPLRDTVLHTSFHGRRCSDSPRALQEELLRREPGLEHLWTVDDQQAEAPGTARAVAHLGADWYEALARSRFIVTNVQLPEFFERREGQYVVQTWHGTPLKRIGRDLAGTPFADERYIASLPRRARQWNLLVSPSTWSTPVLRRSFGYEGEVLESGYPRNDVLHGPGRERRARRVREELGIPDGVRVVLYAPTWREDRPLRDGRYSFPLPLDPAALAGELGDGTVLLVRQHHLVTDRVPGCGGRVRDVSDHPDPGALMLVADVLVTDYSSLLFDFAPTGRPLLFYTPDLDHYRDVLRGFCFDFERDAPGPLLRTPGELAEALRDPQAATSAHRDAHDRFRARFCDLDDGRAAARVAARMLAEGGLPGSPAGHPHAGAATGELP